MDDVIYKEIVMLFKKLLVFTFIILASFGVAAKDLKVAVKLIKIDAVKTSETLGDELYYSITEYSSDATPKLSRVPMFPLNWLSKQLPTIGEVVLWQGTIKEKDSVLLILTLLEQDNPPWNSDDHIGSVQVKLGNKNGKLISQWGQPTFKDQPKVEQPDSKVPKFLLFGENSQYVTIYKIEVIKN